MLLYFYTIIYYRRKNKQEKKSTNTESASKKPKKKLSLERIKEIFSLFFEIFKFLKKHLVFYEFTAKLNFGLEDAAETGILTGAAWGVLYNIVGFVDRTFVLKNHCVDVVPDFENEKLDFIFECGAGLRVFWVLSMLFALLKNIKRIRKVMQS